MNRLDFLNKAIRYILLVTLAIIVFALGNKVVSAKDCSECPGKGVCNGKTDCNNY